MTTATHAGILVRGQGFTFIIARPAPTGRPVGETLARVSGRMRTLRLTIQQLQAAADGGVSLLVFTDSSPARGVVVAVIEGTLQAVPSVEPSDATHVTVVTDHRQVTMPLGESRAAGHPMPVIDGTVDGEGHRFTEEGRGSP